MTKGVQTDEDEASRFHNAGGELPASSSPPHPASCVIPFPSQDRRAASVDLAAAGDPLAKDPAAFIQLGIAVAAVVMRLRSARPSIKVLSQTTREEEK